MKTIEITDEQINALEHDATEAGDEAQASTCRLAIYGKTQEIRDAARAECARAIDAAKAMDND